jgi:hypothetical protein
MPIPAGRERSPAPQERELPMESMDSKPCFDRKSVLLIPCQSAVYRNVRAGSPIPIRARFSHFIVLYSPFAAPDVPAPLRFPRPTSCFRAVQERAGVADLGWKFMVRASVRPSVLSGPDSAASIFRWMTAGVVGLLSFAMEIPAQFTQTWISRISIFEGQHAHA